MFSRASVFRTVLAGLAALGGAALVPATANAEDLIEFLWGGGEEWGGSRETVSFSQQYDAGQIIVSFADRRLYLIERPGVALSYPIAVPREQSRWQGKLNVTQKRENPSWTPTPEMFKENPKLPSWVPGGHPMNPLGVRALYLGSSTYRIHGTDAPWTIGQAVSKGCIRMFNDDVLDLYPRIPVGTVVTVTWEKFKTAPLKEQISRVDGPPAPIKVTQEQLNAATAAEVDPAAEKPQAKRGNGANDAFSPRAAAARAPKPVDEIYSDDGYMVDNSGGSRRVIKYGRKPPVTRTSATPNAAMDN